MFASLLRSGLARGMRAVRIDDLDWQTSTFRWEDTEPAKPIPRAPFAFLRQLLWGSFRGRILVLAICVVFGQGIEAFEPYALKMLVDGLAGVEAGTGADGAARAEIVLWFWLLVAIWIGGTLAYRVYQIVDVYTSPSIRALSQKRMFAWLMGHSPRYFQDNFAGKLGQKIKQGANAVLGMIEVIMFDAVRLLVLLVVASALLWTVHPGYSVTLVVWTVAYIAISGWLARHCIKLSEAMSDAVSTSSGRLIDVITNAELVRGFARLPHERLELGGYLNEERFRSRRLRWFLVLMRFYQLFAVVGLMAAMVWVAIRQALGGALSVGDFTLVVTLLFQIAHTVWMLSDRMLHFFEELGTLSEALELVSAPHEIVDAPEARPLQVTSGGIEIRDLHFSFPDGTKVFDGLDLAIAPGEKVGLVGRSGAGKSTLVKLIRRQFEPQQGRVLIDGQDIARVTLASLNAAIAEVPQQPGVFHRPIGDNIRYGRPDADQEAIEQAARQAHAHDFIVKRPTGFDTVVGEQGIKLSGGERQRLAISRALLKDARILVLDEATSALDSESEHLIQEALWTLMQGRTVIAIAHRLSTVTGMDRILYVEAGRIVEQGSHAELLALGGRYAQLWYRQSGGFLEAAE